MTRARFFIVCLLGSLVGAFSTPPPAASGASDLDYRRFVQSYQADSRLRIDRDHHRGRSFTERRSRLRNPSYLRREERRRALSEGAGEHRPLLSDLPAVPGQTTCRTMTSGETIEERRALVTQRECIDASGISHIAPGSRRVIRYYDE
jgi:hypothetical protein